MKNLIVSIVLLSTLSVASAAPSIVCATYGNTNYQSSPDAIKLGKQLGKSIKTCDGKQFKAAIKMLKLKVSYVDATAEQIKKIEDGRSLKINKRLNRKLSNFKF